MNDMKHTQKSLNVSQSKDLLLRVFQRETAFVFCRTCMIEMVRRHRFLKIH